MHNITVGIPRGLFYYYYVKKWQYFFDYLKIKYIISPETSKDIVTLGSTIAQDEMCLSMKNYLGHVLYLKDKCDYILIPRIEKFGHKELVCTNFLAAYDLVSSLIKKDIIHYNINTEEYETEYFGFMRMGKVLGKKRIECEEAYSYAIEKAEQEKLIFSNIGKFDSKKKNILLVGHSYNLHDALIGNPVVKIITSLGCEVLFSDYFNPEFTRRLSSYLSHDLYWKYSKESVGAIKLCEDKVDGIIFLTTFPCGIDSMVNFLMMKKIKLPKIEIIIDDMDSLTAIETKIESFIDIIKEVNHV